MLTGWVLQAASNVTLDADMGDTPLAFFIYSVIS
jgi:hypothetical protein